MSKSCENCWVLKIFPRYALNYSRTVKIYSQAAERKSPKQLFFGNMNTKTHLTRSSQVWRRHLYWHTWTTAIRSSCTDDLWMVLYQRPCGWTESLHMAAEDWRRQNGIPWAQASFWLSNGLYAIHFVISCMITNSRLKQTTIPWHMS